MWPGSDQNHRSRVHDGVGDPLGAASSGGVIDSDVDLHDPRQRAETRPRRWDLLLAIAVGGVLGAEARYGLSELLPHTGRQFPWSTVIINVSGSALIGALMVILLELTSPHRLVRPLLGVGVLGGYTTFSSFALDAERLVRAHEPLRALAYVLVTVVLCLLAVVMSTVATRVVGRIVLEADVRHHVPGSRS
jgi:CrcB protein